MNSILHFNNTQTRNATCVVDTKDVFKTIFQKNISICLNVSFSFRICRIFVLLRVEEMSVFPRISLKTEVTDHLRSIFLNKEVGADVCVFTRYFFMSQTKMIILLFSASSCWHQLAFRRQNVVSRSCSRACHTLRPTHVYEPVLISLLWMRSDASWVKNWGRWAVISQQGGSVNSQPKSCRCAAKLKSPRNVFISATDVQHISRGGRCSHFSTPERSRCAAPSCQWSEVWQECLCVKLMWLCFMKHIKSLLARLLRPNLSAVKAFACQTCSNATMGQAEPILVGVGCIWQWMCVSAPFQACEAAQLRGCSWSSVWMCRAERGSCVRPGDRHQPKV